MSIHGTSRRPWRLNVLLSPCQSGVLQTHCSIRRFHHVPRAALSSGTWAEAAVPGARAEGRCGETLGEWTATWHRWPLSTHSRVYFIFFFFFFLTSATTIKLWEFGASDMTDYSFWGALPLYSWEACSYSSLSTRWCVWLCGRARQCAPVTCPKPGGTWHCGSTSRDLDGAVSGHWPGCTGSLVEAFLAAQCLRVTGTIFRWSITFGTRATVKAACLSVGRAARLGLSVLALCLR